MAPGDSEGVGEASPPNIEERIRTDPREDPGQFGRETVASTGQLESRQDFDTITGCSLPSRRHKPREMEREGDLANTVASTTTHFSPLHYFNSSSSGLKSSRACERGYLTLGRPSLANHCSGAPILRLPMASVPKPHNIQITGCCGSRSCSTTPLGATGSSQSPLPDGWRYTGAGMADG